MTVQCSVPITGTDGAARRNTHPRIKYHLKKTKQKKTCKREQNNMFKMPGASLTGPEGEPLAGQRAACVVDSHHPNLVGRVRLQILQVAVTLLHRHAVLLRHNCGQRQPRHQHCISCNSKCDRCDFGKISSDQLMRRFIYFFQPNQINLTEPQTLKTC